MATRRASSEHIRWFEEIGIGDVPLVGGKNASLGEMNRQLTPKGVKVHFTQPRCRPADDAERARARSLIRTHVKAAGISGAAFS